MADHNHRNAQLDLKKMYPVGPPDQTLADQWTWDYLLTASEKCLPGPNFSTQRRTVS